MRRLVKAAICTALVSHLVVGQSPTLTLQQAVGQAVQKYPAVRSSLEQVSAAAAGINLARTGYLPRLDFLGQANRATHNNVFGYCRRASFLPFPARYCKRTL